MFSWTNKFEKKKKFAVDHEQEIKKRKLDKFSLKTGFPAIICKRKKNKEFDEQLDQNANRVF